MILGDWVDVNERLPDIDTSGPEYSWHVRVITCSATGHVCELTYGINGHARSSKGRMPRWEEPGGRLAFSTPTHWMPMPKPPKV